MCAAGSLLRASGTPLGGIHACSRRQLVGGDVKLAGKLVANDGKTTHKARQTY